MLRSKVFHITLLILITAGVYANSLGGSFVYDDKAMIAAYDLVKDISNIPKAFVSPTSLYGNVNYYRPLQTVSYIIDNFLWGDLTCGYHLTNVFFHILSVLIVYVLVGKLFKDRALAFITSCMFAVHPVHTGVVSYIAGRADSMLCFFMITCLIFYIKFRYEKRNILFYTCSLIFFILALLTKELAMIIPLVIIILDKYLKQFTTLSAETKGKNSDYLPFAVVICAYLLFRVTRMSFFVEGAIEPFPFWNRFITVPYIIGQYFRFIILPNDLHMGRDPWVAGSLLDARIMISVIIVAAVVWLAYSSRKKLMAAWFGMVWFLVTIFPQLNIITPLFYTISENWLYIPSIGLFLALGSVVKYGYVKWSVFPAARYAMIGCMVIFISLMSCITITHNLTWRDEISLGVNTLKFNPREFKVYNNVGVVYLGRGELDKAEEAFRKCLEIKPDTGMAYFNLYRVYMARNKRDEALGYLKKARELDPKHVGILIDKMGIRD